MQSGPAVCSQGACTGTANPALPSPSRESGLGLGVVDSALTSGWWEHGGPGREGRGPDQVHIHLTAHLRTCSLPRPEGAAALGSQRLGGLAAFGVGEVVRGALCGSAAGGAEKQCRGGEGAGQHPSPHPDHSPEAVTSQ